MGPKPSTWVGPLLGPSSPDGREPTGRTRPNPPPVPLTKPARPPSQRTAKRGGRPGMTPRSNANHPAGKGGKRQKRGSQPSFQEEPESLTPSASLDSGEGQAEEERQSANPPRRTGIANHGRRPRQKRESSGRSEAASRDALKAQNSLPRARASQEGLPARLEPEEQRPPPSGNREAGGRGEAAHRTAQENRCPNLTS